MFIYVDCFEREFSKPECFADAKTAQEYMKDRLFEVGTIAEEFDAPEEERGDWKLSDDFAWANDNNGNFDAQIFECDIAPKTSSWNMYLNYLVEWALAHSSEAFKGNSPVCFDEFLDNEAELTRTNIYVKLNNYFGDYSKLAKRYKAKLIEKDILCFDDKTGEEVSEMMEKNGMDFDYSYFPYKYISSNNPLWKDHEWYQKAVDELLLLLPYTEGDNATANYWINDKLNIFAYIEDNGNDDCWVEITLEKYNGEFAADDIPEVISFSTDSVSKEEIEEQIKEIIRYLETEE